VTTSRMSLDQVVAGLVQKVERRFYGKYRALVVDNEDPENLGRLKVQVPSVLGSEVVSGWATPCVPHGGDANLGWLSIPEVGAGVWVEFEDGDLEFPIWVGTFWSAPGGDSELPKSNDSVGAEQTEVQSPPTRKIFKTRKGNTLQFEDADDAEEILVVFRIDDSTRHVLRLSADGVEIRDANGNSMVMTADAFDITSAVALTISAPGQAVTIVGDTIDLNKG
jgi:uncharacterized protein involved in type VI secretion and phage assembly